MEKLTLRFLIQPDGPSSKSLFMLISQQHIFRLFFFYTGDFFQSSIEARLGQIPVMTDPVTSLSEHKAIHIWWHMHTTELIGTGFCLELQTLHFYLKVLKGIY